MIKQLHPTDKNQRKISNKQMVLQCLGDLQLLNAEAIIALMVTDDLLLAGLVVSEISPFSLAERTKILRAALSKRATGVIIVEVYPRRCPWPALHINIETLADDLSIYNITLVDLLVVEQGGIQSRHFP